MANVTGRLILNLTGGGDVQIMFLPNEGAGKANPMFTKDMGYAEEDIKNLFGVHPQRAKELIAELESKGHAAGVISVDEGVAKKFFSSR